MSSSSCGMQEERKPNDNKKVGWGCLSGKRQLPLSLPFAIEDEKAFCISTHEQSRMKMERNAVLTNVCHGLWVQVVEMKKELCEKELRLRAKELHGKDRKRTIWPETTLQWPPLAFTPCLQNSPTQQTPKYHYHTTNSKYVPPKPYFSSSKTQTIMNKKQRTHDYDVLRRFYESNTRKK
jgi:hypothetical protein